MVAHLEVARATESSTQRDCQHLELIDRRDLEVR